jgi:hypothetical protein
MFNLGLDKLRPLDHQLIGRRVSRPRPLIVDFAVEASGLQFAERRVSRGEARGHLPIGAGNVPVRAVSGPTL